MIKFLSSKSFLTNIVAAMIFIIGWYFEEPHVMAIGSYALSGAITNWLAIIMLFDKIPYIYGSGVIPNRFNEFKQGIKQLVMEQFFTLANMQRFFQGTLKNQVPDIDLKPILACVNYDQLFQSLVDTITTSSLGGMLNFIGGPEALTPLKDPFITTLQSKLAELGQLPELKAILAKQQASLDPNKIIIRIEQIVDQRLNELTPQMVKLIIQKMIREHLGWLVIWGGIFGAVLGFGLSFTH